MNILALLLLHLILVISPLAAHAPKCARDAHAKAQRPASTPSAVPSLTAATTPATLATSPEAPTAEPLPETHDSSEIIPLTGNAQDTFRNLSPTALQRARDAIQRDGLTQLQVHHICKQYNLNPELFDIDTLPTLLEEDEIKRIMPKVFVIPTNNQMADCSVTLNGTVTRADPWSCGYRSVFNACLLAQDNEARLDGVRVKKKYQKWLAGDKGALKFVFDRKEGKANLDAFIGIEYVEAIIKREADKLESESIRNICCVSTTDIQKAHEQGLLYSSENNGVLRDKIIAYRQNQDPNKSLVVIVHDDPQVHFWVLLAQNDGIFLVNSLNNSFSHKPSVITEDLDMSNCIPGLWSLLTQVPLRDLKEIPFRRLIR